MDDVFCFVVHWLQLIALVVHLNDIFFHLILDRLQVIHRDPDFIVVVRILVVAGD